MSQARVERERIYQAVEDSQLNSDLDAAGMGGLFGVTTAISTYPTSAKAWYGIRPCLIDGTQAEGQPATYASNGAPAFLAWNCGKAAPPLGTPILCFAVGGKWVFQYDG